MRPCIYIWYIYIYTYICTFIYDIYMCNMRTLYIIQHVYWDSVDMHECCRDSVNMNETHAYMTWLHHCDMTHSHVTQTFHMCPDSSISTQSDRKKSPPPGGFPICYVPSSRTVCRRPPSKDLYQVLRGGSSYTRLMRENSKYETPPGGGGLFRSNLYTSVGVSRGEEFVETLPCALRACSIV